MTKTTSNEKIQAALELLNTAAAEQQAELQDMIGDGYDSLKELVVGLGNGAESAVHGLYSAGKDEIRATATEVDHHVHEKPWQYIGGGMAVGFAIGLFLMRCRK